MKLEDTAFALESAIVRRDELELASVATLIKFELLPTDGSLAIRNCLHHKNIFDYDEQLHPAEKHYRSEKLCKACSSQSLTHINSSLVKLENAPETVSTLYSQSTAESDRLRELELALSAARQHISELSKGVGRERAAAALAMHELDLRSTERDNLEACVATLKSENAELLERWLRYKELEAEQVNAANQIHAEAVAHKRSISVLARAMNIVQFNKKLSNVKNLRDATHTQGEQLSLQRDSNGGAEICEEYKYLPSQPQHTFSSNQGGTHAMQFHSQDGMLICAGEDRKVHIWDTGTFVKLASLSGSLGAVLDIDIASNGLHVLGGCGDKAIRLWDMSSTRIQQTLTGHSQAVCCVMFSRAAATHVVSCAHDRAIKCWDTQRGWAFQTFLCSTNCNAVCHLETDDIIASGHFDGSLRIWDTRTGLQSSCNPNLHLQHINTLLPLQNGTQLITVGRDHSLKLMDARSMKYPVRIYTAPTYRVGSSWTRASATTTVLASGSADGSVFFW
eukprot:CAMPEP_0183797124 /NCGR_PEP_ID=MMETSP0803_2-20130417/14588_1 /TAXON_ID=195967 /ORGANISM="Crustomastix stigmata, Strain CCMP3273" /LENGTH=506 /DNA_ID=CAMNT_0026041783 /DNA_START=208 /DNA_END=1725 /DNA_ORIENTATION=-